MTHLPDEINLIGSRHALPKGLQDARLQLESEAIRTALERNGFSRLAAARELGMHKSTLFRKIKQLGLIPPEKDGRSKATP